MGLGLPYAAKKVCRLVVFGQRCQTPVSVFYCPSRRLPKAYGAGWGYQSSANYTPPNVTADNTLINQPPGPLHTSARNDYAMNAGGINVLTDGLTVPASVAGQYGFPASGDGRYHVTTKRFWGIMDNGNPYTWSAAPKTSPDPQSGLLALPPGPEVAAMNGVGYPTSMIRMSDITDGASNTYLLGEKWMKTQAYLGLGAYGEWDWGGGSGEVVDRGDTAPLGCGGGGSPYTGGEPWNDWFGGDTFYRYAFPYSPLQDAPSAGPYGFGSAHAGSLNMSFCDGSVRQISYTINMLVHFASATRNGHEIISGQ